MKIKEYKIAVTIFLILLALVQRLMSSDLPVPYTEISCWKLQCNAHYS